VSKKLTNNTLNPSAFWSVNKVLAHYLESRDAALLLSDLIGRRHQLEDRLTDDGGFFVISEQIENDLMMTRKVRTSAIKVLQEKGLVSVVPRLSQTDDKGLQTVNFFYIQDDIIEQILKSNDIKGGSLKDPRGVPKGTANKKTTATGENSSDQNKFFEQAPRNNFKVVSSSNKTCSEMTETCLESPEDVGSVRTPPSIETIIQDYISGIGNPKALVDKRGRDKHLVDIVATIQAYGYSKSEATKALATLTPYVVQNAIKSLKKKNEWAADLKRDWEILVKAAYAPAQPAHPDMINKEANIDTLNTNIDDIFEGAQ
jgi:hypothetical protein